MKNAFKKAFTGVVAVLTIVSTLGLANVPQTAQAASAGDVIKGTTLSTVYYYGSDGSRYAFPNEKSYFTWYTDFSDVVTLSDSALASIPLAGNIVYRPGSRWIKIQSDPKTYAVTTEGEIRWIETEEVAEGLAGSDWNAFIDDVSDTFFVDYTVGTSLMSAIDGYEGALVADGTTTYMISGGEKLSVSAAGMTANRLQSRFVLDGSGVDLDAMTTGTALTVENTVMTDTAQLGGATVATGGLSVSLASDTAASATIPAAADSVPVATYKLTATDGDVTVSQMIFRLGGVGATANISNVYLYEGNDRLTNARSINATTREVTLSPSNDLVIEDGETTYITVRIDVAAAATTTAGDTVYFSLVDASDVTTDSDVSGNFPVSSNTMTFSDTSAGTLTVTKNGSISNPTVGEEGATIAKVKFAAATEGASLEQVMFDVDNAADHENFELYNGSELLALGSADGKKVTFVFATPLVIAKGDSETLTMKADIGGETSDVLAVAIEESSDVMAVGSIYGFNMGIDVTAYDQTGAVTCTTECSESTLQGGELTFAFNGPSSADIAVDSNDVVLMNFTLTSANWTELQHLPIALTVSAADTTADDNDLLNNTAADANYTDICVRLEDGTIWMGPEELTVLATGADANALDQTQTLTFDDYQELQAGESFDLMVTVDVGTDTDLNADKINAAIVMASVTAEDINGDALATTDIVPTANVTGYNMTLTTSSLTVDESSTPSAATYVVGTASVPLVGYSFTAGNSSDITISDVTYLIAGDSDTTFSTETRDVVVSDHVSSCSVYDNVTGALIDGPEGVAASTTSDATATYSVSFENFSWTVEAGGTEKMLLKCNLANVAADETADASNDTYKAYLETTDSVPTMTAENADGDSVTPAYDIDGDLDGTADADDDADFDTAPAAAPQLTVTESGSLTVTKASDAPTATIVLGSSTGVSTAKYRFAATNEAFVVNQLQLVNSIGATYDRGINSVTISYTNSDGATETKTGYMSNAIADFGGLDLYVPTTEARYLTVTIDTNTVSSTGATSGDQFDLDLDMLADTMQAVGVGSGTTIYSDTDSGINSGAATDLDGNTMTLYKTKPTISLASGSPSGSGIPGLNEIFRFNVAADSRGYVIVNEFTFKVNSQDIATSGWNDCDAADWGVATEWALYDSADVSTELGENADWLFYSDADSATCVANEALVWVKLDLEANADNGDEIAAGSTITYILKADTTGASPANDDSLRIDIDTEANILAGVAASADAIEWEDDSNTAGIDGTLVKNLPVNGGTIIY